VAGCGRAAADPANTSTPKLATWGWLMVRASAAAMSCWVRRRLRFPRRTTGHRHQLDIAASHLALHKPTDAIEQLLDGRDQAPEWMRHQGYARGLVSDLVEARRRAFADEVGLLADHIGLRL
jgi:hypothetical protein